MTRDPVVTGSETPLEESLATMIRHRVRHLPILAEDRFVGFLCAADLAQQFSHPEPLEPGLAQTPTRALATWVEPLRPEDPLDKAVERLKRHSCLPVLEQNRLVGLFSQHNLMRHLMRSLSPQRTHRGGGNPTPHRLDSLVNLVRRLSQAEQAESMLQSVIAALRPIMPIDQAFILFRRLADDYLSVAAAFSGQQVRLERVDSIPLRDTLSGYVCLQARSLRIDDLQQELRFPRSREMWSEGGQLRSVIAVPLLDHNLSFGVLQLWSTQPYTYLDSDLELLELAGGYIASLIQRNRRLQEEQDANRIKDEFLAVVTHDLRNTIQGVMSYSQLLQRHLTEPRLQSLAQGLVGSARHMANLTNDLHDLARLGMQAMRVEPQRCHLVEVVAQVLEEFADFAAQEGVDLRKALVADDLYCQADPVRLRQILGNLVSNAIKYHRPGGWVEISACAGSDQGLDLWVEDNGIGIPPEAQSRVFELFARADNHRRSDSSGLGLAISKRLVELHGGTLGVVSQLDHGSRFLVHLPG